MTKKIVVTGGPCAGKTSVLEHIKKTCTQLGYKVFVINETATELILGGMQPEEVTSFAFQTAVLDLQLAKEDAFDNAAKILTDKDCIIICDRGVMDGKAYLADSSFNQMLSARNISEEQILARYDAVFYLDTTAKNEKLAYGCQNNSARLEKAPEEALVIADNLKKVWQGHKNLTVIPNFENFSGKIKRVNDEISSFLNAGE